MLPSSALFIVDSLPLLAWDKHSSLYTAA